MPLKSLSACLLLALLLTLPGCGGTEQPSPTATPATVDNPFEQDGESQVIGRLSVGPAEPLVDEEGNTVALQYIGEEVALDCMATGAGTGRQGGVMLFLDGMPQPFRTDTQEELAYLHSFTIPEDNDTIYFQVRFTPVTGKAGDTSCLSLCYMNNPLFQPDMVETKSYAGYHQLNGMLPDFEIKADPPPAQLPPAVEILDHVTVTNELRTEPLSDAEMAAEADAETAATKVSTRVWYEGTQADSYDTLDVTGKDTVHVTYRLFGGPAGGTYRVMFFADHQLTSDGKDQVWTVTVGRNEQVTVEADVRVDQLEGNTTFYPLMAPTDEMEAGAEKEHSVLFYRTD